MKAIEELESIKYLKNFYFNDRLKYLCFQNYYKKILKDRNQNFLKEEKWKIKKKL